ncbi:uncharacterized protein RCC_00713 [Ramularia collo-cygni]|uniref:Uncharacterized protein n=1 Tax=Ramularia collo-cygni TaxID=112498 RepID=A0A2D3V3A1_9PEZI|nr:uncharacterized protein RCC_00713 [Ramularia collo-cygni]CZT14753.1 uncharacterized protein RCC_00713 [Ramularia collo-cygni]
MDGKSGAMKAPSKTSQPDRYRDEEDAVSMHTTRSDYDYEDAAELPSYTDSVVADNTVQPSSSNLPPADEYQIITPPKSATDGWRNRNSANKSCSQTVSIGCETTVRMDERLSDATQLYDYVFDYLRVIQPRPAVRVQGWHWQTRRKNNKNEQERVYDFDVVLSLQPFLPKASNRDQENDWWIPSTPENSEKVHRGRWRKSRAKGYSRDLEVGPDRKPELLDWCEDFCTNKSALKIFRVARSVTGLDTEYIKQQIEPLVRQTNYRGHVDITFPIADKNVDIYTPHWVNQARIGWVRWIFYLTFLWIFTWPILLFTTKRWSVYQVEWRFSRSVQDDNNRRNKVYATISEAAWVKRHANLIKSMVLDKFHGDATDLPLDADEQRRSSSRGVPQTGNANVDTAVSFLQGGLGVWNSLNGRGGDAYGWGEDS